MKERMRESEMMATRWVVIAFVSLVMLHADPCDLEADEKIERMKQLGASVTSSLTTNGSKRLAINLEGKAVTDFDLKLLQDVTELRSVDISGTRVSVRGLRWLLKNRALEVVRVESLGLTDSDLRVFLDCKQLVELDLDMNSRITGRGFRGLVFPRVASLSLAFCSISEEGLAHIVTAFPNLKTLDIGGNDLSSVSMRSLLDSPRLRELKLADTRIGDDQLSSLAGLDSLQSLDVTGTNVSDLGLRWLAGAVDMASLTLTDTWVTGEAFHCFPNLTDVILSGRDVRDETIEHLLNCQSLEDLFLSCENLTDSGIAKIGDHSRLSSLTLSKCRLTREAQSALFKISTLEELILLMVEFNDDSPLKEVDQLRSLKKLHIEFVGKQTLPVSAIRSMSTLESLEELTFIGGGVTTSSLPYLANFKSLRVLTVSDVGITQSMREEFQRSLPRVKLEW